jgi:PTH1 family peptidyl-tRNA hydrolase
MIKGVIGLGNEGDRYRRTYHNVGAFVAAAVASVAAEHAATLRLYPLTGFMNESGVPVARWLKMNNLTIADVVVVHDEADLPLGSYKLVRGGGSAGHKGIESVVAHTGTPDFWRLRIGIRNPEEAERKKAIDFVLNEWSGAEEAVFREVAAKAALDILKLAAE